MKLAIAVPEQAPEYEPFDLPYRTPAEIRQLLHVLYSKDEGENEVKICSMDRTVLDQVTSEHAKIVGHMTYEDVLVYKDGKLIPLLELHDHHWLCHSALGDLFSQCAL